MIGLSLAFCGFPLAGSSSRTELSLSPTASVFPSPLTALLTTSWLSNVDGAETSGTVGLSGGLGSQATPS
jgi:hypothetical protein